MKNAILPQVSSQLYSFGSSETDFSDIPLQIGSEFSDGLCMDSNFYTNQDNLGGVLAFCSESQINYQSEPPSVMTVKRLDCPALGLDHSFNMPAYGNISRQALFLGKKLSVQENEVHVTKKTRKCSTGNPETMAERAGKNMPIGSNMAPTGWMNATNTVVESFQEQLNQQQVEETITRIRRGRVPARRSQKLTDKITALQKLVSPYGKTDTASVLQEACISIKALQDQIQNLCNESHVHPDQKTRDENEVGLRGKGLCLVPVSLSQKVADQDSFSQMLTSMSCFTA